MATTKNTTDFATSLNAMGSMKSDRFTTNIGRAISESSRFVVSTLKTVNLEMDAFRAERFKELHEDGQLEALAMMRVNGL